MMKRVLSIFNKGWDKMKSGKTSSYEDDQYKLIAYLEDELEIENWLNTQHPWIEDVFGYKNEREREREREKVYSYVKEDCKVLLKNIQRLCDEINKNSSKLIFSIEYLKDLDNICRISTYNGTKENGFIIKIKTSNDLSQHCLYIVFYQKKEQISVSKNIFYHYRYRSRSRSGFKKIAEIYVNLDQITDLDLKELLKWIYYEFKHRYTPKLVRENKKKRF